MRLSQSKLFAAVEGRGHTSTLGAAASLIPAAARGWLTDARDPVNGPSYMQRRLDYLDYVAAAPRPSGLIYSDDSQIVRSSSSSRHESRNCCDVTRADRLRLEAIVLDRSAPKKHVWRAVPEQSIDAMAAALDGLMKREAKSSPPPACRARRPRASRPR